MKELGRLIPMYLDFWNKNGEKGLPFLIEGAVSSRTLMIEYKKLPPIESLPENERNDLIKYGQDMFPDGPEEKQLKASKITYVIGTLL